jgi:glycosyltransferase
VVDGASSDRTLERIGEQAFQPDLMVSEPDSGIYDALNKGIRMATGDFVGFLHAGDIFATSGVLHRIACAIKNSGAEALYGDLQYVRPRNGDGWKVVRHWTSGIYYRRNLRWGWMPPHPALYLKRDIYERTQLENGDCFDVSYRCAADYDFMVRILADYGVEPAYVRTVLVQMRVGGISNGSLRDILRKSREDWRVIRAHRIGHLHTLLWKNIGKLGQFMK